MGLRDRGIGGVIAALVALRAGQPAMAAGISPPDSSSIPTRLWDSTPGGMSPFSEGYPIGNGHIGAIFPGGVPSDTIVLNEDSLWSGALAHRVNQDALTTVQEMQPLVRDGQILQAHSLAGQGYVGTPTSTRNYAAMGFLTLAHNLTGTTTAYERWLDIADSTAGVYFVENGVAYQRELLASNPDDVIAIQLTANATGALSFSVHLDPGIWGSLNRIGDFSAHVGDDTIIMGGTSQSGANATYWVAGARVVANKGQIYTRGDYVNCVGADEATVYFSAWTSYYKSDPQSAVLATLAAAANRAYADVRADHVADYQNYANAFKLDLGQSTAAQRAQTTAERMIAISPTAFDPELAALYVQYGRYLLISTSRNGTLPPNLQGIWNNEVDPEWGSKYTININLEMNYWPSLTTGLADLVIPLFEFLKTMNEQGQAVARQMYNCSGTVTHHNTDIWGDSAPQDNYLSSTWWPMGSAWMVTHVIEYYRFTGNQTALQDMLSYLVANAQFALDFLTPYEDYMVTNPSLSPENTYVLPGTQNTQVAITLGPTIDNSILWEIFGFIEEIRAELGLTTAALAQQVSQMRAKLMPLRLNQYGGIAEWYQNFTEAQPGISHMSNLWPAYPGSQITSANKTTFTAAEVSLNHRLINGGGDCGWSRAWVVNLGARFFNTSVVNEYFTTQLSQCTWNKTLLNQGGPTPFQIDANFGTPAGIFEALMQSHEYVAKPSGNPSCTNATGNTTSSSSWGGGSNGANLKAAYTGDVGKAPLIRILPALPSEWAAAGGEGAARGLVGRGGFVVDVGWGGDATLQRANISSTLGGPVCVTLGANVLGEAAGMNASTISIAGQGSGAFVCLMTTAGGEYAVTKS